MTKVLLITGGASGIGAETARRAASRGYSIAINYRTRDAEAKKVVADVQSKGAKAIAIKADMASESDIVRMFEETTKALGPITHLLNSAGISTRTRVDEFDAKVLAGLFATNVTGLMICCREAAKRMSTKHGGKGGAIVNVSSMAATLWTRGLIGLCRDQRCSRLLHQGFRSRSGGRRHPRELAAAWHGADRDDRGPPEGSRLQGRHRSLDPDAARRQVSRDCRRSALAVV